VVRIIPRLRAQLAEIPIGDLLYSRKGKAQANDDPIASGMGKSWLNGHDVVMETKKKSLGSLPVI
jgi:hypothetical protein